MVNRRPVIEDLAKFWPASVELALAAIAISAVVGIPLGVLSAVRAGRWLDRLITPGSVFLGSMPIFWLGLMAVLVFYRHAGPPARRAGASPWAWRRRRR